MMPSPTDCDAVLALVRAGLWLDPAPIAHWSAHPLPEPVWQRVLRTSLRESVVGLVYRGTTLLPDGMVPPHDIALRLLAEADRIERNARTLQTRAGELTALLAQHGVKAAVLKGPSVAAFYAEPCLRTTGDIDLFVPPMQFDTARQLLKDQCQKYHQATDGSCSFFWKGIIVEITPRRFSLSKGLERKFEAFAATSPDPETAALLLLLSSHIFKHAAGYGIGLKQICDLTRVRMALTGRISDNTMAEIWAEFGMAQWNKTLEAFIWQYLGGRDHLPALPAPDRKAVRDAAVLLKHVWRDGNFGLDHRKPGKLALAGCFARNAAFCLSQSPALYGHVLNTYLLH